MNKKLLTAAIMTMLISSTALASPKEEILKEDFVLDQVIVTAQRYEKNDLDIGASVDVYTKEDLKNTGARNVQQALSKATGLVYQAKGPGGASLGSMTSKVSIRGVEKGTMVLINGTPVNWRGLYNLEDIPVENVERIEIVKGGGSVLYGSAATGGVINIIMKNELINSVSTGVGNYGQQNYQASFQEGKLGVSYTYDKWGNTGKISSSITEISKPTDKEMYNEFDGSEKNDINMNYAFNDNLNLMINHGESRGKYIYHFGEGYKESLADKARYNRTHKRTKDFVQLNFKDGDLKGNIYYNSNDLHSTGTDFYSSSGSDKGYPKDKNDKEENLTYGFDVQKVWQQKNGKLLAGTTYQKEGYESYSFGVKDDDRQRNNYSLYTSWETNVNEADIFTLSARESWTTGADEDKNYDNFSAQGQYVHKVNEDESIYASIGQSFAMPSFSDMYSTGSGLVVGNADLKPQKGMHYEMGWKKNHEDHTWRVALFNYKIKDYISFKKNSADSKYYAVNQDVKNTGLELSSEIKGDNGWSYNYGVTYSNPQSKSSSQLGTVKNYWDREFGKWQLNGGVTYQKERLTASLTANYLADRVLTPSSAPAQKTKPYLLTTLNINYAINEQSEWNLSIDNVLDRDDNVNHTSSAYYSAPTNFMLSYKYKF